VSHLHNHHLQGTSLTAILLQQSIARLLYLLAVPEQLLEFMPQSSSYRAVFIKALVLRLDFSVSIVSGTIGFRGADTLLGHASGVGSSHLLCMYHAYRTIANRPLVK
jgi:hypothetical protein